MLAAKAALIPIERQRSGTACSVGKALAALDDTDRQWLASRLEDPNAYPSLWLSKVLAEADVHISRDIIDRHRRRLIGNGCRCPK